MNKRMKIIGAAAALIVLVGGYVGVSSWANEEALREVRVALLEANLDRAVRYRDVSASVLGGSVTLHDVEIRDADGRGIPIEAKRLIVSDLEQDHDALTAIRVRLEDLTVSILDAARRPNDAGAFLGMVPVDARYELIGMGYSTLQGSLEVFGQLDPDLREARAEIEVDFEGLQTVSADLTMAGVDHDVLKALIDMQQIMASKSAFSFLSKGAQVVGAASRLELMDLQLRVEDRGLNERLQAVLAEKYLVAGDEDHVRKEVGDRVKQEIAFELNGRESDPRIVQDVARHIANYVQEGGELSLTTNIIHPLPLFERGGLIGIRPAPVLQGLDRFMVLADARWER